MFMFNAYNPFKVIADEVKSDRFKAWVIHKTQNDIQVTVDAMLGGIEFATQVANPVINTIRQATHCTLNQGQLWAHHRQRCAQSVRGRYQWSCIHYL